MLFLQKLIAPRGRILHCLTLFALLCIAVNFPEGYTNSYPNTAQRSFQNFINESLEKRGDDLSDSTFTWLWTAILNVWFVGYLIGTFATTPLTEIFGRKMSLILANLISMVGAFLNLLSILINMPEIFFVGRIISSIGSGISFGALILFLQEVSPTRYRGVSSFMCETAFILTTVLGILGGMDVVWGNNLAYLTGLPIIPAAFSLIITLPLMETPKFLLLNKKNKEAAKESILFYHGSCDVGAIMNEIQKEDDEPKQKSDVVQDVLDVFRLPHLRTAFLVGMCTLQLIVSFWPLTYLSTGILEDIFPPSIAQWGSLIFIVSNFVAALVGLGVVERFGRRSLVLNLGIINTLSLVMYTVCDRLSHTIHDDFKYGCIAALVIFGVSYGVGLGPIAFFITSELVAQQYRSLVQSLVFALNCTVNLFFSAITLPLYNVIGTYSFIPLFIVPNSMALVYLFIHMPETKNREIYDIVAQLIGKESHSSKRKDKTLDAVYPTTYGALDVKHVL